MLPERGAVAKTRPEKLLVSYLVMDCNPKVPLKLNFKIKIPLPRFFSFRGGKAFRSQENAGKTFLCRNVRGFCPKMAKMFVNKFLNFGSN